MIPLPNAAIPLVNPILRTSLLCQIWDSPPDYLIEMRQLVSIQNSTLKKYYKFDVSSFWHSLGFSGSFFPVKIQFKKVLQIHVPAFGVILVLAAAFFCKKTAKKYKKDTSSKRSHTLGEPCT